MTIPEIDPAEMSRIRQRPLRPFEFLETTPRPNQLKTKLWADRALKMGFSTEGGHLRSLQPPIEWEDHNRSFRFHLQAFLPIKTLLLADHWFPHLDYLAAATAYYEDWANQCPIDLTSTSLTDAVSQALDDPHSFRWYDMAIGQRLHAMSYLYDAAIRQAEPELKQLARLRAQIVLHHNVLKQDVVYKSHSNHGLYQAITQFASANRLPEIDSDGEFRDLSRTRLFQMLDQQFNSEGMHVEHSPGYHLIITTTLINALKSGCFDENLREYVQKAEARLAELIMPDGALLTFGDTSPKVLANDDRHVGFFQNSQIENFVSKGTRGQPPETGVWSYKETGYAIGRLPSCVPNSHGNAHAYLAQNAAFHSRTHKHSDHMSFVWHDRERPILIDPGRYGYFGRTSEESDLAKQGFWYADPKRIYVETTRAHNCIEVDGKSFPRRGVRPWGSALEYAGNQNGLMVTDCFCTHFRYIRHRRKLILRPGHFLLVLDWLNDRNSPHNYRQWFQIGADWTVLQSEFGFEGQAGEDRLSIRTLLDEQNPQAVQTGEESPQLQGWYEADIGVLRPSPSVHFTGPEAQVGRFATLISLAGPAAISFPETRFNATLRSGQTVWQDELGKHALTIRAETPGHVNALFTTL